MGICNKTAQLALDAIRTAITGGNLYLFAGPVPADSDDALSIGTSHTLLVKMTESGDGSTGLTFAAVSGTSMSKTSSETWKGTVLATGTAAFYRFCAAGDDGTAADPSTPRLQGTLGLIGSGADFGLSSVSLTAGDEQGASGFSVVMSD